MSRGVRQGGILSPSLFTLYLDDLLIELALTNVGCYWDDMFVGALAYADDITLLAPTPSALRKLLAVCESIGTNHVLNMLKFNPEKTQCIRFSEKSSGGCSSVFMFCGKYIVCVKSVLHLGHVLAENLQDDLDIQRCRSDFIKRANCVLHQFAFCTPVVLSYLLRCFCMSYYGCVLWNLSNPSIKCLDICMNNILRRVWSLPFNCHTSTLHVISGCHSIYNTCYKQFYKMLCLAKSSCNYLVRSVFHASSLLFFCWL